MPMFVYRAVGAAIRRRRLRRGLTQAQLAQRVSLSRTSITNIEAGRQKLLVHTLLTIAEVLGLAPSELLPDAKVEIRLRKTLPASTQRFVDQIHRQHTARKR